jgi:transposase-like protein
MSVLDAEVESLIGASRYERSPLRRSRRNGHYSRDLDTRVDRRPLSKHDNRPHVALLTPQTV